ncbi:MAG: AMP-binding protein [Acidimicrobiales bacterium]|nr:AMP-binding protein [Acidimicrobiales bacterium]
MTDEHPSPAGVPGAAPWGPACPRPDTFEPFPEAAVEGSIGARFAEVAARHGDTVALRSPAGTWTFAALADDVNRFANALLGRLGAGEEPVALLFDHDGPLVAAMLGTLSAGKLVLVLDPEAAPSVTESLLADSGARLLVADESRLTAAFDLAGPDVTVVRDSALVEGAPATPPDVEVTPERGAMLAYTSGSSGSAKAAVIPHRALLHLMRGATDALSISPGDTLPMLFPVSLAVAAYPMFLPLLNGGTLTTFDVRGQGLADLGRWLADEQVSVMYVAPTVARFMVDVVAEHTYPSLRLVVLGGERVDADAVALIREMFGAHLVVANGYGTTETGVLTFYFLDPQAPPPADATVPVGYAIPDTELLVLDEDGQPVRPGVTGEVSVRSAHLFQGYWGKPELNEMVLHATDDDMAIYSTGDLGRVDENGCLELVGRSDAQVKVRGHRVVLGEVEEALLSLDLVKDAVVLHREVGGVGTLDAFVVPATDEQEVVADVPAIRDALSARVTTPMVPARFHLLDELPTLPNGKLDRQALRDPSGDRPRPGAVADGTDDIERRLVELWEDLLDVRPVGIDEDFFELGGHSLLAAAMLVEVEEIFRVTVPISEMVSTPTILHIGGCIRQGDREAGRSALVAVQEGDGTRPPLFWGHDLHGTALRFRALGRALGPDQPLYTFESPFLDPVPPQIFSLPTLARRYVDDLVEAFPEGPYLLGGYSFGGVLAFEMARTLLDLGHEVGLLAVVDVGPGFRGELYKPTRRPAKPWLGMLDPPDPSLSLTEKVRHYRGGTVKGVARHVVWRVGIDHWLEPVLFRRDLKETGQIAPSHRVWYAWRKHWELAAKGWNWRGATYPGRVELIWADESGSTDSTMGWGDIAEGGVGVHRVPESHEEMMDEGFAGSTAAVLRALIDETTASDRTPGG